MALDPKEQARLNREALQAQKDLIKLEQELKDIQRETNKLAQEANDLDDESIAKQEKLLDYEEKKLDELKKQLQIARQKKTSDTALLKSIDEQTKKLKDQTEALREQKNLYEEIGALSRSFAGEINGMLGIMNDLNDSGFGRMMTLIEKSGGMLNGLNNAAIELSENLKTRVALSIAEKGQEMFLAFFQQLDEVGSNLAKVIPQGRKYQSMVEDITNGNQAAYLSFDDVSQSVIGLNSNFTEFSRLDKEIQVDLVRFGATLDKLGVSSDDFAENIDYATKAMGLSSEEFITFEKQLFSMSKGLGVNMDTLNRRFKDASGKLAQFEKTKALKIFKDMNLVTKNLGIEMNRLFEISGQFDTFESAAEAAGSLNSVLGGNLINTLDLMNASLDNPIEVFKQLKVAVDKTGRSFDSMTPAMRKMIAETMKMDVSEVERLMRMDLTQGVKEMQDAAASMEDMEEAARLATPILDKLIRLGYKFVVFMSPIIDVVDSIVDGLMKLTGEYPNVTKAIGGITMAAGLLTAGALLLAKGIVFVKGVMLSFTASAALTTGPVMLNAFSAGAASAGRGLAVFGATAGKAGIQLIPLAFAIGLVAAGIGLAAWGMSKLVLAFVEFMKASDIEKLGALYLGINGLAIAFTVLAASMVAIGVAAPGLIAFALAVRIALTDTVIEKLQKTAEHINNISNGLERMKVEKLTALANAAAGLANINLSDLNATLAVSAQGAQQSQRSAQSQQVVVNIPGETIKVEIKSPIMLNREKIGELVQEEIVKREDRLVPGGLSPSIGIKTGGYKD